MQTAPRSDALVRKYWCFISYRHRDNRDEGRQWASWLHQQLETYQVPEDLVGKRNERGEIIPARIFPVFRDEEEIAVGDLGDRITRALDDSKVLVVLCSTQAVESRYVSEEITYFKQTGKADKIYAALIEGEPQRTFPEPLRFAVDAAGAILRNQPEEPLAADFRLPDGSQGWTTPEAYRQQLLGEGRRSAAEIHPLVGGYAERLERAKLKLIAGILGVPLGVLQRRDQAYQLQLARKQLRNTLVTLGVALAVIPMFAVGFYFLALLKRMRMPDEASSTYLTNLIEMVWSQQLSDQLFWQFIIANLVITFGAFRFRHILESRHWLYALLISAVTSVFFYWAIDQQAMETWKFADRINGPIQEQKFTVDPAAPEIDDLLQRYRAADGSMQKTWRTVIRYVVFLPLVVLFISVMAAMAWRSKRERTETGSPWQEHGRPTDGRGSGAANR